MDIELPVAGIPVNSNTNLLSYDEKMAIANLIIVDRISPSTAARQYDIPRTTITTYVHIVKSGIKLRERRGRPPTIDNIAVNEIRQMVAENIITDNNHFKEIFKAKMIETESRRHIGNIGEVISVDFVPDRTFYRYKSITNFN
jgi:hypothetical protein